MWMLTCKLKSRSLQQRSSKAGGFKLNKLAREAVTRERSSHKVVHEEKYASSRRIWPYNAMWLKSWTNGTRRSAPVWSQKTRFVLTGRKVDEIRPWMRKWTSFSAYKRSGLFTVDKRKLFYLNFGAIAKRKSSMVWIHKNALCTTITLPQYL